MRSLVQSLLNAIPGLLNVMALLLFVFFVWGVLALQLFLGVLHPRWVWLHSALMRLRVWALLQESLIHSHLSLVSQMPPHTVPDRGPRF